MSKGLAMPSIDPDVQNSIASAIGGAITAFLGGKWWQSRHAASPTHCEKVCSLLVNSFDKLLTALEVAGEPPAVKIAIRDARDSIVTAKNYLGLSGVDGPAEHGN